MNEEFDLDSVDINTINNVTERIDEDGFTIGCFEDEYHNASVRRDTVERLLYFMKQKATAQEMLDYLDKEFQKEKRDFDDAYLDLRVAEKMMEERSFRKSTIS